MSGSNCSLKTYYLKRYFKCEQAVYLMGYTFYSQETISHWGLSLTCQCDIVG